MHISFRIKLLLGWVIICLPFFIFVSITEWNEYQKKEKRQSTKKTKTQKDLNKYYTPYANVYSLEVLCLTRLYRL